MISNWLSFIENGSCLNGSPACLVGLTMLNVAMDVDKAATQGTYYYLLAPIACPIDGLRRHNQWDRLPPWWRQHRYEVVIGHHCRGPQGILIINTTLKYVSEWAGTYRLNRNPSKCDQCMLSPKGNAVTDFEGYQRLLSLFANLPWRSQYLLGWPN